MTFRRVLLTVATAAAPAGVPDRAQDHIAHAGADHEDLRRGDLACRGDLAAEGASELIGKDRKFNALTWDIAGGLRMSN